MYPEGVDTSAVAGLDLLAGVRCGAVEIEVRDLVTGLFERKSLDEACLLAVEDGLPIRQPASYRGQWSKPGWFYMSSLDRLIGYESLFEAWVLLDLDFSGMCAQVLAQPCRIHFDRSEVPYRHVPDYLWRDVLGRRELIDVKGARHAAKPANRLLFDLTRRVSEELGWSFRVASEPAPAYFRNVRLLAGVRHRRWGADLDDPAFALAEEVADRGGMTWGDAEGWLARDVVPWLVPRVVARSLWRRLVDTDLTVPLTPESVLSVPVGVLVGDVGGAGGVGV